VRNSKSLRKRYLVKKGESAPNLANRAIPSGEGERVAGEKGLRVRGRVIFAADEDRLTGSLRKNE